MSINIFDWFVNPIHDGEMKLSFYWAKKKQTAPISKYPFVIFK